MVGPTTARNPKVDRVCVPYRRFAIHEAANRLGSGTSRYVLGYCVRRWARRLGGPGLPNVCFFSYREDDRDVVATIKGRAENSRYYALNFRVQSLLRRWDTTDRARIRQAITTQIQGSSRTIVFVGNTTYQSYWVPEEVKMTLEARKPVYAIRINGMYGTMPKVLVDNGIHLYSWSEARLQELATQ